MQRTYSLKKNAQFRYVHRKGSSSGSHEMVLLYVPSSELKVGFSVGKKIGCAVSRNRVKRRMRACCTQFLPKMKKGLYVFIARPQAVEAPFEMLEKSMSYTIRKQRLFLQEKALTGEEG